MPTLTHIKIENECVEENYKFCIPKHKRRDFFDRKNLMAYQILKQFENDSLAL